MVRSNRGTVGGFFLAGHDMAWWPVSGAEIAGDKWGACVQATLNTLIKPTQSIECSTYVHMLSELAVCNWMTNWHGFRWGGQFLQISKSLSCL